MEPKNSPKHPLSQQEFDTIYSKVPRLTVEIIIKDAESRVYLTKRSIEPCKGQWHLPGGTVRFGEPLTEAVKRIASRETGVEATRMQMKDIIEYPSHYQNGLDDPRGVVFEVTSYDGELQINAEAEAEAAGWFSTLPDPMHAQQDEYLVDNGYLTRVQV